MTDTNGNRGAASTLQNIFRREPAAAPVAPVDYAKEQTRKEAEIRSLAAVSKALEGVPRLVAQSHDTLAQQFLDLAESAAKTLEQLGDSSLEDGQRRRDEYYRLAQVTRQKGAYQAKEAVDYIQGISTIRSVSTDARKPAVVLPPEPDQPNEREG